MYQIAKPLFLICETPLHAGSGSDLGIVDLPIQRERHTDFPKIEGSSLKGALREAVEQEVLKPFRKDASKKSEVRKKLTDLNRVFGHDSGALKGFSKTEMENLFDTEKDGKTVKGNTDFAGAIGFTDARLLLFPVKSLKGVFAWITCEKVLKQFETDMKLAEIDALPSMPSESTVAKGNSIVISPSKQKVVLEEYTFEVEEDDKNDKVKKLGEWLAKHLFNDNGSYWSEKVKKDIIVLPDDDFKDFVNLSTEVITRTKISNETGTVEPGALFTEEYLPSESVLYTLVLAHGEFRAGSDFDANEVLKFFNKNLNEVVQIGGSATIGKGLVRTGKSFF
ncbi:MAG: type III-B CRISPR module RAMP protein Cmr4 [Chitinophagales bacterium]